KTKGFRRAGAIARRAYASALLPAAGGGFGGGLVGRPRDEPVLGDAHLIARPVGHRHVGARAVERVHEGGVLAVFAGDRPKIDAAVARRADVVGAALAVKLLLGILIPPREAV